MQHKKSEADEKPNLWHSSEKKLSERLHKKPKSDSIDAKMSSAKISLYNSHRSVQERGRLQSSLAPTTHSI